MDNDAKQAADFYRLVAWAHANRKRLIWAVAIVLVVVAAIGGYIWHKNSREEQANNALSKLKLPLNSQEPATAASADNYLKVANDYPGTAAAARALLIGGGIFFDVGDFKRAQGQFERFLSEYAESPLVGQALLGVAASLEAQGKTAEAASRYEDLLRRHAADSTTPQAKSALARLYLAQNKPEQALNLYEELAQGRNNDSWSAEAGIQAEELLAKYPNLRKPVTPPPPPVATATNLTLPKPKP